jgi:hypothetical protein
MILLAGASLAALASTAADAANFAYTGSVQTYTVTQTGLYTLSAAGAQGGKSNGGLGASVSGKLSLTSGTTLNVVVGGQGGSSKPGGAGGGGSFIYRDLATPFAVAGGGGGGYQGYAGLPGLGGDNASANSPIIYPAGTNGSGGYGALNFYGGGGGGWLSNGGTGLRGGKGGPSGFAGGGTNDGGFGGGGGSGVFGGGGGGGFSGGGGGYYTGGGGGGSFLDAGATDTVLTAGVNSGNGSASIDLFSATGGGVPEPSSWAMLMAGFGGIGAMLRRRRLRTA